MATMTLIVCCVIVWVVSVTFGVSMTLMTLVSCCVNPVGVMSLCECSEYLRH